MKEKQHIYRWLFLPLLTCLMAVVAGCSNELTEKATPSAEGGTYLTVTARGITDQPATDGNYDDYVASLRILAFDENGAKLCNELYKAQPASGVKQWTKVGEDAVSIREQLGNGGGNYSFYFIANEEDYSTMEGNTSLKEKLEGIAKESDLNAIEISFTMAETDGKRPLLMTAVLDNFLIYPGKENTGVEVRLVRALAKAKIEVVKENPATGGGFTVNKVVLTGGQIPSSYALLEGQVRNTKQYLTNDITMTGTMAGTTYTSSIVYMPERPLDDSSDESQALKVALDIEQSGQTKSFELPIADGRNTANIDYSIHRNYDYTTTGIIKDWSDPIIIYATVAGWEEATENREWLGSANVQFNPNPQGYTNHKNTGGYLYVVYDETTPTTVTFSIKITAPVGNEWKVVCSNPSQFEATIEDGTTGGIIKADDTEHTITIKAKDSYPVESSAEQPSTDFYVTFSNGDYVTDMVIRSDDAPSFNDGYAGGTQTRFTIVQERVAIN